MQPYDYTIQSPGLVGGVAQGLQFGAGIKQMQDEQAAAEQQKLAQQQMNADLSAASQDISKIPGLMVRYPQLAEKLKIGWETKTAEQQRAEVDHGAQVLTALQSNRPDLAASILRDRATALRNSGDEQAAKLHEAMAESAQSSPDILKSATAMALAARPGGDKLIESITKAQMMPSDVAKSQAEAATAGVKAKYAESDAMLDLQKKGWDIQAVQNDIEYKKQANRIAAMNASVARESNDLKRQELALKVKDAQMALDEKIRDKVASAESGAASIDNMLNTIERIKKNPALNSVVGPIEGSDYYPQTLMGTGVTPALGLSASAEDRNDAMELIKTLGSQAFLSQIPAMKGQGALSNAEGEKLQSALTNLSRKQSEPQFRANLDEAARLLKKGRETLSKRTGVPLQAPDTPAAPGARPPLDSFMR